MTGAAYSTGNGWWNDADGRAGTLRAAGHPHEANILAAEMRNGTVNADVVQTLLAHKNGWSVNDLPMVLQESQAFVKAKRASSVTDDDTWREEPVSPTLNVFDNGSDTRSTVLFVQPVNGAVSQPQVYFPAKFSGFEEGVGTLRARDAKGDANLVLQGTVANALTANMVGAGGGACDNDAQAHHLIPVQIPQSPTGDTAVAAPLGRQGATGGFRFDLESCGAYVIVDDTAKTLTTSNQRLDPGVETFVVVAVGDEVAKTLTTAQRLDPEVETFVVASPDDVAKTLTTSNGRLNPDHETFVVQEPSAFTVKGNGEAWVQDMVTGITTGGGLPGQGYPAVIQPTGIADTFAFQPADQTLGKGALRAVRTDVAPTIALGDHHSDRGLRIVQEVLPLAFSAGNAAEAYGLGISENIAPPLRAAASGSNQVPTVLYQDSQYGVAEYDTAGRIPEHQMVVTEAAAVVVPALVRMREGAPGGGKGPLVSENLSLTLATGNDQVLFQPVAFTQNQREEVRDLGMIASALSAESGSHQQTYIAMTVPEDDGE